MVYEFGARLLQLRKAKNLTQQALVDRAKALDPDLLFSAALLIAQRGYGLGAALLFGFFGGAGATVALMCLAGLRREVSLTSCPKSFQGIPIELVTVGLMALSLVGFYGLHLS